jgi:hypothetical protein
LPDAVARLHAKTYLADARRPFVIAREAAAYEISLFAVKNGGLLRVLFCAIWQRRWRKVHGAELNSETRGHKTISKSLCLRAFAG